jgi:hypothetical protein
MRLEGEAEAVAALVGAAYQDLQADLVAQQVADQALQENRIKMDKALNLDLIRKMKNTMK